MTDAQRKANKKWRSNHKEQYKLSMYGSYAKYYIRHCTIKQFYQLQLYMDVKKQKIINKILKKDKFHS